MSEPRRSAPPSSRKRRAPGIALTVTEWARREWDALSFSDLRRLEREWATMPGYLDEWTYWWLATEMITRLIREEPIRPAGGA